VQLQCLNVVKAMLWVMAVKAPIMCTLIDVFLHVLLPVPAAGIIAFNTGERPAAWGCIGWLRLSGAACCYSMQNLDKLPRWIKTSQKPIQHCVHSQALDHPPAVCNAFVATDGYMKSSLAPCHEWVRVEMWADKPGSGGAQ
jgi:hypothetical protein